MRNGIYRVLFKGHNVHGAAATLFVDGHFISCDRTHNYLGHYTDQNGRFAAQVFCKRHTYLPPSPEIPDVDEFHMMLEGVASGDAALVRGTIPEKPGFVIDVEYIWMCEVR
jgi:hypothetical protein